MVNSITGVLKTYEVYKSDERYQNKKLSRADEQKDTVAISGRAKDYQSVRSALHNIPDIRDELVSAVKAKYESNVKTVSDSEIAEKLIGKL